MTHGNKKYFFEHLVEPGDTIVAKTKNPYSLKNAARLYIKETNPEMEFEYSEWKSGSVVVTRKK